MYIAVPSTLRPLIGPQNVNVISATKRPLTHTLEGCLDSIHKLVELMQTLQINLSHYGKCNIFPFNI